jgi:D-alanyl-D-alanine carboxypeptidase
MADILPADQRGWGRPCSGRIVTITPLNMTLPVRAEVATIFHRFILEAEERGFRFNRRLDDWGYACRHIRSDPSLPWSNHAWGLAVDLDATQNPYMTRLVTTFPRWIAGLAEDYLLRWGGDFTGEYVDPMHFEFVGTPADAGRITRTLKEGEDMTPAQEAKLDRVLDALAVTGSTGPDQSVQKLYENVAAILNALAITGTTGPEQSIELLYQRAKGADLKGDQALAGLSEIRTLVEQILLRVGGSE